MYCAGIDAGSRTVKIVLFDPQTNSIKDKRIADQSVHQQRLISDLYQQTLAANNITAGDIKSVIATGYGRNLIPFADQAITEITCHAAGVSYLVPEARTIVDIGGQDSKIIKLDRNGKVRDFAMNDRCAAGTGCFLEVIAKRLETSFDRFEPLLDRSSEPAMISSMCVVFAETEIIGLLAGGADVADIIAGVQNAVAGRIASMPAGTLESPACFTGGVALVPGMQAALTESLALPMRTVRHCQYTAAIGAAIKAAKQLKNNNSSAGDII